MVCYGIFWSGQLLPFFVGPNADEQNLSKKATVICQDENPSSSEKRLRKGTIES